MPKSLGRARTPRTASGRSASATAPVADLPTSSRAVAGAAAQRRADERLRRRRPHRRAGRVNPAVMGYYDDRDIPYYWNIARRLRPVRPLLHVVAGRQASRNHMYWVAGAPGVDRATGERIPPDGFTAPDDLRPSARPRASRGSSTSQNYDPGDHLPLAPRRRPRRAGHLGPAAGLRPLPRRPGAASRTSSTSASTTRDLERGTLPAVSYIAPSASSEHPPGSVAGRPGLRAHASSTRADAQPRTGRASAFMWTYDDWGGWYDHVKPPQVDRYGLRLPGAGAAGQPLRASGLRRPHDAGLHLDPEVHRAELGPASRSPSRDAQSAEHRRRLRLRPGAAAGRVRRSRAARAAQPPSRTAGSSTLVISARWLVAAALLWRRRSPFGPPRRRRPGAAGRTREEVRAVTRLAAAAWPCAGGCASSVCARRGRRRPAAARCGPLTSRSRPSRRRRTSACAWHGRTYGTDARGRPSHPDHDARPAQRPWLRREAEGRPACRRDASQPGRHRELDAGAGARPPAAGRRSGSPTTGHAELRRPSGRRGRSGVVEVVTVKSRSGLVRALSVALTPCGCRARASSPSATSSSARTVRYSVETRRVEGMNVVNRGQQRSSRQRPSAGWSSSCCSTR